MFDELRVQEFDRKEYLGRPAHFDVDKYLDCVEMMIYADEVERALQMLDNMPGYFRDHVPDRAQKIKNQINQKLFTPVQYANAYDEFLPLSGAEALDQMPLRGHLVAKAVEEFNRQGICPHLMELGPGTFWLPLALRELKYNFTFEYMSLHKDKDAERFPQETPKSDYNVFCCFEVIEHLWKTDEIYQNYVKFQKKAQIIFMSTPLYTVFGGEGKWWDRDLGHLRTYTPSEFTLECNRLFNGYNWDIIADFVMVAVGKISK